MPCASSSLGLQSLSPTSCEVLFSGVRNRRPKSTMNLMGNGSNKEKVADRGCWMMLTKTLRPLVAIWLQWLLATSGGLALGLTVAVVTSACWTSWAVVVGFQWIALRRHFDGAGWWATATVIAVTIAGVVAGNLRGSWNVAVIGSTVGLMQWFLLRRRVSRVGLWVPTTALAWTVGAILVGSANHPGVTIGEISSLLQNSEAAQDNEMGIRALGVIIDLYEHNAVLIGGGGIAGGVIQWLVLRGRIQRGFWLLMLNAAGWSASALVAVILIRSYGEPLLLGGATMAPDELRTRTFSFMGAWVLGLVGMGLVPGVVTGLPFALAVSRYQVKDRGKDTTVFRPIDFVIVTVLKEEREAVLDRLPGHWRLPPSREDVRTFYQAELPVVYSDGQSNVYRIVVMPLLGMGRVQAATATVDAIRRWHPRYIMLVGIAGGVASRRVQTGDILISDQIVDYELQKLTTRGPEVRWEVHRADPRLLDACNNVKGEGWQELIQIHRPKPGSSKCHTGAIASGDKVVSFREILDRYRDVWPTLIGVEMEAAGVATAAFQSAGGPGFFMIRCASDLSDEAKGSPSVEAWRQYACEAAASFAIALLMSGPVPPNNLHTDQAIDAPSADGIRLDDDKQTVKEDGLQTGEGNAGETRNRIAL